MKSIWRGNISFALVSIPIRLYGATKRKDVQFHLLHKKCSTPLNYERHCPSCNAVVPWEDTTHGYEYEKGRFVVLTDKEIEGLPVKSLKSIDILKFIEPKEIDPIYYDKTYYLEPGEGAEHSYVLLRETMLTSGRAALAKMAMREKEHMAVIRVIGNVLALQTLFYADEIIKPDALSIPGKLEIKGREMALASDLLKHFVGKFDIAAYSDEFRKALLELINAKISGHKIKVPPAREAVKVVSLMDALKKSLARGHGPRPRGPRREEGHGQRASAKKGEVTSARQVTRLNTHRKRA